MSLNDMMSPSRRIERQKCDRLVDVKERRPRRGTLLLPTP